MFKKILALCITLTMLLSIGTVMASAELPEGVTFYPGKYGVEDAEGYSTIGDIAIQWDPDASSKLNLSDGNMSD